MVIKWLEIWLSQTIYWFKCRFSPSVIQTSSLPEKNLPRDENVEAFVVHVTFLNLNLMPIHLAQKPQIALLVIKEMQIPSKYLDSLDVFLEEKTSILPKTTKLNQHVIELQESQQLFYRPIYSLGLLKLKTLKTYIKTNLANGFIGLLKSPTDIPILFVGKPDSRLRLCIDYWVNNLTIKNQYPLLLIGESLDWLGRAKRFIQLDFTSAYHQRRIKENNKWKTAFCT